MDGSGHHENGRHKTDQYKGVHTQWMIPSHMMKDQYALSIKFMAIITERDAALQERDLALSEKRAALAERDMAILQRDAAINERNNALIERDNAIASYEYQENDTMNCSSSPTCHTKFGASRGTNHMHQHQYVHHSTHLAEDNYHTKDTREVHTIDALSVPTSEAKPQRSKRTREIKTVAARKTSKPLQKCKRKGEDLNKKLTILDPNEWKTENGMGGYGEDLNKALVSLPELKDQDLSLNQVFFDDSSMPVPVCSCTGVLQQCYKWGNGGWQSACCTTTLSMHPLPMMPNKRHARIGGRKMSGSAFTKLLSRLASEGHDLSIPLDLKDHWAKHGTNRYITIK